MAQSGELYQIAERRFDNDNIEYFAWVYTNRLAKKTVNGRKYYDIILLSSSSICPYCGQELASTLDHYLPKEKFLEFSISPCNLVPCCPNCNSKKSSYYSRTVENQILHPYYDNFQLNQWLFAVIQQLPSFTISFIHRDCEDMLHVENNRAKKHFELFNLANKYAALAAQDLTGNKFLFETTFISGGQEALTAHLRDKAESHKRIHLNSWQHALYQELANSQWFTFEGFRQIGV